VRKNLALAKLRAGKVAVGLHVGYASPDLAEQAAHVGFDWVWLDAQHGEWTEVPLNNALARFLAVESTPIVRVRSQDPGLINRTLDMGAMGVMVPMVQNAEQARAAAQAVFYPPLGRRSAGGARLNLIAGSDKLHYYANANEEMLLVVQVETEEAVANVAEIMAVPGVAAVLIGPRDLSLDVEARGHDQAHHERLVEQVVAASRETGTAAGYLCAGRETAQRRIAQGFRFIALGTVTQIIADGMQELFAHSRDW